MTEPIPPTDEQEKASNTLFVFGIILVTMVISAIGTSLFYESYYDQNKDETVKARLNEICQTELGEKAKFVLSCLSEEGGLSVFARPADQ